VSARANTTDVPPVLPDAAAPDEQAEPQTLPVCAICDDVGYYTQAVSCDHPHFGVLFPCACRQRAAAAQARAERLQLSQLTLFRTKTFARFNAFVPGVQTAYRRAYGYAQHPQGWLSLFGGYGSGKTHLAAAVANALFDQDWAVLLVVVPDLLDHLRATFAPESSIAYDAQFERVRSATLLVLDDLGAENPTAWVREKLYQLINHRYNAQLPTVITSNVALSAIDPRIASRLCDPALGAGITQLSAADYRRRELTHQAEGQR
jgi:DNA replication protein DnaC